MRALNTTPSPSLFFSLLLILNLKGGMREEGWKLQPAGSLFPSSSSSDPPSTGVHQQKQQLGRQLLLHSPPQSRSTAATTTAAAASFSPALFFVVCWFVDGQLSDSHWNHQSNGTFGVKRGVEMRTLGWYDTIRYVDLFLFSSLF